MEKNLSNTRELKKKNLGISVCLFKCAIRKQNNLQEVA